MALTTTQISQLYVAIFNRASEGEGNAYWAAQNKTAAQIADDMLNTTDAATYFGSSLDSNQAFIEHVYLNTLNKTVAQDPDGIAYWVSQLAGGASRGEVVASLVTAIDSYSPTGSNYDPTDLPTVRAYNQFANRVEVSNYMAETVSATPTDYATSTSFGHSLIVTDDASTVNSAKTSVVALVPKDDNIHGIDFTGDEDSKVGLSDMQVSISTQESSQIISLSNFRNSESFGDITGSGYSVVILDTGIDLNHSFFGDDLDGNGISDRIVYTRDFTNDGDGTVNDVNGHGTNVASITASSSSVYTGMAPDANIIALQVLSNNGQGSFSWLESALQWVVNNAQTYNIAAINMSLGDGSNANTNAITSLSDELAALDRLGVINVAAAGNEYYEYQAEGASNPATDANMISVGATFDASYRNVRWGSGATVYSAVADDITPFSQRSSDVVDIFAPGAFITGAAPGGGTASMTGTSQAAPHIAGIAVLAQQLAQETLGRNLSNDEFSSLLQQSGVVIIDGDGENDNVTNTGESYYRVDMNALGEAIVAMGEGEEGGDVDELPPSTDIEQTTATKGVLTLNETLSGTIDFGGDKDWFKISLVAGAEYRFDLNSDTASATALSDPYLELYSSTGEYLTSNDDSNGGRNASLSFIPSTSGDYFVSAKAYGSSMTGDYTLAATQVQAVISDDYAQDITTFGSIESGTPETGHIELANDQDWFAITITAGNQYTIELNSTTLTDPYIYGLYDSNGTYIAGTTNDNGAEGYNARMVYQPLESGTYFVSAAGNHSSTGTYQVSVTEEVNPDDYQATTATLGTLALEASSTGSIEQVGDTDWFAMQLETGYDYTIDLTGNTLSDTYIRGIYDSQGVLINGTSNDDSNGTYDSQVNFTPTQAGTYYLSAGAYGSGTGTYTLDLSATQAITDDYLATIDTAGVLGTLTSGSIETAYDRDWFKVTLEEGYTYTIDMTRNSLTDAQIYGLYDASGNYIFGTYSNGGSANSNASIIYTPSSSGSYYVAASGYDNATGTYSLSMTQTLTDDYRSDIYTAGVLRANSSTSGEIEVASDSDWFAMTLRNGYEYTFNLSDGTLTQGIISGIFNSSGLSLSPSSNTGEELVYTPTSTSTYYIGVTGDGAHTGSYSLSSTELYTSDDYAASRSTTGRISVGSSATGNIEQSYDNDWFAISLAANTEYVIDLEGSATSRGTLGDTYIRGVYDASGTLINGTYDDDSGSGLNSQLTFTASQAGTYYINAGAYSSGTGTYRLSVDAGTAITPDIGSSVDDHGTASTGSTLTGTSNFYYDQDWYGVQLYANYTYQINATSSDTSVYLYMYDEEGNYLSSYNGVEYTYLSGYDASLTFTPQSDGFYFVDVYGYGVGQYSMSIDSGSARVDDYAASSSTTGRISVGSSATGNIEQSYDNDWFAISLGANTEYVIDLEGSATSRGTLGDTYIRGVYDASGTLINGTYDDDSGSGLNSQLTFTASQAGTYYINAGAYSSGTGTYRLSVGAGTAVTPDVGNTLLDHGTMSAGSTITGVVDTYYDNDWYAIDLTAGYSYDVSIDSNDASTYLYLRDAQGNYLYNTSDGVSYNYYTTHDASLTFTPSASGTYYVDAYGYDEGSYTLSVSNATAIEIPEGNNSGEIGQSVSDHGVISVGGTLSNTLDSTYDLDWYVVTLTAGHSYQIDLKGLDSGAGTLEDPVLYLYNNIGTGYLAYNDDTGYGFDAQITYNATVTATYFIQAGSWDAGSDAGLGTYTLSIVEIA